MTARPQFDGPVEHHQVGTVNTFEDLSIGLGNVWPEGASLQLAGNGNSEILDLKVGEAGESQGVHLRLCAVWIDPSERGTDSNPGSDASQAYYVIGRGDSAPECPAQISPSP